MNSIRLHIRGQMGVQILQAATAISTINEEEEPILCVNTGGNLTYDGTNKLNNIFDVKCRVIEIDDTIRKTPYWIEGAATYIFKNRAKVIKWLVPKTFFKKLDLGRAVHIRGLDKNVASMESYDHLVGVATYESDNVTIYSDDPERTKKYSTCRISNQTSLEDWIDIYHSEIVYAAPSAFIMSMLILDPNKHVVFLGDKYCNGTYGAYQNDMLFIREAQEYCPNMVILDD